MKRIRSPSSYGLIDKLSIFSSIAAQSTTDDDRAMEMDTQSKSLKPREGMKRQRKRSCGRCPNCLKKDCGKCVSNPSCMVSYIVGWERCEICKSHAHHLRDMLPPGKCRCSEVASGGSLGLKWLDIKYQKQS